MVLDTSLLLSGIQDFFKLYQKTVRRIQGTIDPSGESRPSAKEGACLTMNVEFCEDNSGTSKKMCYFQKNKVGACPPGPLDPGMFEHAGYCIRQCVTPGNLLAFSV